jgi:undecaprenyl diphosphate synthase
MSQDKEIVPNHVAVIMDGNGRWAKNRGLPRTAGHIQGIQTVRKILRHAAKKGVKVLTLFTFSTENWSRPKSEISFLFSAFKKYLTKEEKELIKDGVRFNILGRREPLPKDLLVLCDKVKESTRGNKRIILNLAFNYGGRAEIIDACSSILSDVRDGKLKDTGLNEEVFSRYLYSPFIPDADLLIRTSGEFRISNFLLWRLAYSELYFTDVLWPDFGEDEFDRALEDFKKRKRRFGGL